MLHKRAARAAVGGDYVTATRLWREAYEVSKQPKYLYNLARTSEEMDRPSDAYRLFEKFLSVTAEHRRRFRRLRARARKHLKKLTARTAMMTLVVPQQGAEIFFDQENLGTGPFRRTLRVDPGRHVVTVKKEKHHTQTRQVSVEAGSHETLEVVLSRIKPKIITKVKLRYPLKTWLPWVVLGAGGAVAVAGIIPLALGAKKIDQFDKDVQDTPGQVTDDTLKVTGERMRDAGIAMLVVGAAGMAAGVLMAILNRPKQVPVDESPEGPSGESGVHIQPFAGPGGVGVRISGVRW